MTTMRRHAAQTARLAARLAARLSVRLAVSARAREFSRHAEIIFRAFRATSLAVWHYVRPIPHGERVRRASVTNAVAYALSSAPPNTFAQFRMQADSRPPREASTRPRALFCGALALCLLGGALLAACGGPSRASSSSAPRASTATNAAADAAARDEKDARPRADSIVVSSADSDSDGIPDAAELYTAGDREGFRRWFTALAEAQFYEPSAEWNETQRDCAGLVRFAWREALRPHDRRWLARMGPGYEQIAPDVRAYTLGRGPLGERLFRTAAGSFRETDTKDETFSEFADARTLKDFNTEFVSRDARRAAPGDLMFFHQPWAQKYPYHVMVFLGPARNQGEGERDWVVYHTGTSAADKGTVKKVRLAVLAEHPNARWRPVERNRNFLGFYRLKILQ